MTPPGAEQPGQVEPTDVVKSTTISEETSGSLTTAESRGSQWTPEGVAASVMRQMKFVGNMKRIGWLEPGAFGLEGEGKGLIPIMTGCVRYRMSHHLFPQTSLKYAHGDG
jgi:hypothetical protein